jgi:hypothetical protein
MLGRVTAVAVWLILACVHRAAGQEGPAELPPPNLFGPADRNTAPAVLPRPAVVNPSEPSPPQWGGPRVDPRQDWSLGDYGPGRQPVATDLYPPGQSVGWYAGFDIGIMKPNLKMRLTTPGSFATPTGNPISLPAATLDWVGVPQFNLGYRFAEGVGELRLGYRLLASAGTDVLPGLDPPVPGLLRTRLDVQTVDLDYISPEYIFGGGYVSPAFLRELRGGFGLRVASAFFDSRAAGAVRLPDTHVSSSFGGVGPRMFLELHQDLGRPDVQVYSRLSASGVLGPIRQRFSQTAVTAGGPEAAAFDTGNRNIGIGILQAEAGVSWEPNPLYRRLRLTAAYSWERWWNFGRTDDSNAELTLQGLLLRAEFRY